MTVSTGRGEPPEPPGPDPLVDRLIARLPAALHADLHESADRLLAVRTPKQAQRALEDEYEHVLRRVLPYVIDRPLLRNPTAASAFTASFAAMAATVEEADELLTIFTAGTLTAPGTSVVVAVGLLSVVAETYAAASVRVHQLRSNFVVVDSDQLANDVRTAVLGGSSKGQVVNATRSRLRSSRHGRSTRFGRDRAPAPLRMVDGAASRIGRRWVVGAVPVVGIGYAAFDSARSVGRVLALPIPVAPPTDP